MINRNTYKHVDMPLHLAQLLLPPSLLTVITS